MGTVISLDVGGISVSWSKNSRGIDHGHLFQEGDVGRVKCETLDYDYYEENDPETIKYETALTKPLGQVIARLELLGFTLAAIRQEYEYVANACRDDRINQDYDILKRPYDFMSFQEFCDFVAAGDLNELDDKYIEYGSDDHDTKIMGRFTNEAIKDRIPYYEGPHDNAYSELTYFGGLIDILHPYSMMRLLALNPNNQEASVVWQYGPLVNNGWAELDEFTPAARRREKFLIATEGSSDVHILQHAINLIRPEIADFFTFIDISRRHPFSGSGNLVRFAEGLEKIDVHNQVLFLLDNDVEGNSAYQTIANSNIPLNMRAMVLPTLDAFRNFPTRGPQGAQNTDINGKAAAIECYLDLTFKGLPKPEVIWTGYKKKTEQYQGELLEKEKFTKAFLRQTKNTILSNGYDLSKLEKLLDKIFEECCTIAVSERNFEQNKNNLW